MSGEFDKAIAAIVLKINSLEQEAAAKKRMVNELCEMDGQSPRYAVTEPTAAGLGALTKDAFYGKKLASVVREVLERRKAAGAGAASANEIYDALIAGGYHFETKNEENAKRGLYQSLTKNSSTFHKLPNGTYGLREWYPNLKERSTAQQPAANAVADDDEEFSLNGDVDLDEPSEEDGKDPVASTADAAPTKKPR